MIRNVIIEGLDRLGKSTLVEGLEQRLGCFTKIHYGKPPALKAYTSAFPKAAPAPQELYQRTAFRDMFRILESKARILLDRAHLGEFVYAPMYRGYSGDYIFELEAEHPNALKNTLLVLLVNDDPALETLLIDDGQSFDWAKRSSEQELFKKAFEASKFAHKMLVHVSHNGGFADKDEIADAVTRAVLFSASAKRSMTTFKKDQ